MALPSPARPPLQARSRKTLARIVEASRALIEQRGLESLTVQDVVARARISVGSFYGRFSGREELLRYLDEELGAREQGRWEEALRDGQAGAGLEMRVRAIVELLLSSAADVSAETHERLRAAAAGALLAHRREIRHPDPESAVALGYAATLGAARHRPAAWPGDRLAGELARMWLGYLRGGATITEPPKGPVDFFNVWA